MSIGGRTNAVQFRRLARLVYGGALPAESRSGTDFAVFASGGEVGRHREANTRGPAIVVGRKGSHGSVHWSREPVFVIDTAFFVDGMLAAGSLRWLYYVLRSSNLKALSQDVGIPGLTREAVHRMYIPMVDPLRQMQTADLLDRESIRIDGLHHELMGLRRTLAGIVQDGIAAELVDFEEIPLRYGLTRIDQGWSPECEARPAGAGEWGVLKAGCVNHGHFRADEHKRLPDALEPRLSAEVRVGDVLMSRANTRELVGSVARVDALDGRRLMLSDKHYRLHLRPELDPGFVTMVLGSRRLRDQIEIATAGASSSMQNISLEVVRRLRIPDVPAEEQSRVNARVSTLRARTDRSIAEARAAETALAEYRDALIAETVTGKLDLAKVSDSQMDESLAAVREGERPEVLSP